MHVWISISSQKSNSHCFEYIRRTCVSQHLHSRHGATISLVLKGNSGVDIEWRRCIRWFVLRMTHVNLIEIKAKH